MKSHRLLASAATASVMIAGVGSHPSSAQEAPVETAQRFETSSDIIVTARKRDERLIDVPISIQVISDETIRATGSFDLQDLKTQSGFTFIKTLGTGAGGRAFGNITFRGLQGEGGQQFEASGAIFVDGIFLSGGQSSVNTVDVERVEILKGPQNAFFGRSTFGGAINFITKRPADELQATVNASVTARGSTDFDATVEGPIIPGKLSARITALSHRKVAYYRATDGGELGEEDTRSITGTLYATPAEGLWVRLRGQYQKDEDSAAAVGYLQGIKGNTCVGKTFSGLDIAGNSVTYSPFQPYYCGSIPTLRQVGQGVIDSNTDLPAVLRAPLVSNSLGDPFLSDAPTLDHQGFERETVRLSAQAGVELPYGADLAVNLGYNSSNQVNFWDLDRSALRNYFNVQPVLSHDLTADARITTDSSKSIRVLIGASYFSSTYQLSQVDLQPALAAFGPAFVGPLLNLGNYNDVRAKVPAVYGSVDWDIVESLTLSLEGRYQWDKTKSISRSGVPYVNRSNKFLPRVSLSFKPNSNSNIYATYSEGVQPLTLNGGFINAGITNPLNPALVTAARAYLNGVFPGVNEFSPVPTLKNYEIGVKQALFNGKFDYSIAAFYERWNNRITAGSIFNPLTCTTAQAQTLACPLPSSGLFITFGNDVRIKGVEFSASARPTDQLTFTLYAEYKDAEFPRYFNPGVRATLSNNVIAGALPAVTFLNREVSKSPDLTGAFSATYRDQISTNWAGYVRTDINYVGKQWETDYNFAQANDFARVNLRVGIERENTTFELFVKNLLDDKNWDNAFRLADLVNTPTTFAGQGVGVSPPDKREIGIRAGYTF